MGPKRQLEEKHHEKMAAAAVKDAKKKPAKDTKSSKDKAGARKDKSAKKSESEKTKKPSSRRSTGESKANEPSAPPPAAAPVAKPQDPDAVQLFRRYDRSRSGALLRTDFLQLLRDYAQTPSLAVPFGQGGHRQPLSLTDSSGIPLGYERSEKNSEFEAGQLFERYDKDHSGSLSLDKFHEFFFDFHKQLRGFVDDLGFVARNQPRLGPPETAASRHHQSTSTGTAPFENRVSSRQSEGVQHSQVATAQSPVLSTASTRAEYQATLWELRKICRDELQQQRERMRNEIDALSTRLHDISGATGGENGSKTPRIHPLNNLWSPTKRQMGHRWPWIDDQLVDRYDVVESDLKHVDEILRVTRRQLRKGMNASDDEMQAFLSIASELLVSARELAMNTYNGEPVEAHESRQRERLTGRDRVLTPRPDQNLAQPSERVPEETTIPTKNVDREEELKTTQASVEQLQKTLRIKDQLIYQLLQERTALRKQKAIAESDLHDLSQVSTHEMRKWAQLTDEMQEEIALLRDRLKAIDHRGEDRYTRIYA